MTYVVDAHTLVWVLSGNPNLSRWVRTVLQDQASQSVIPAIALAEIAYLHRRGRIPVSLEESLDFIEQTEHCIHHPMDVAVVQRLPSGLEMHDGLIVATALARRDLLGEDVAVVTKDAEITASGLVPVVW